VLNIQHAYAKALLVDRAALAAAQADGDVLGGHRILIRGVRDGRATAVRQGARRQGAAADPIAALRASGYVDEKIAERSGDGAVTAGWGL
jgi:L-rhamnose isomerase/sugar isomerase